MIITLVVRVFQLMFAVIVLGLSTSLIRGQGIGGSPPLQNFNAFVGGFGIIAAIVGILGVFLSAIAGTIVPVIFDVMAAVFSLAAGISMAVKLGAHSCKNELYTATNSLINGGSFQFDKNGDFLTGTTDLEGRCHKNGAETAFEFFAFVAFSAGAALAFMAMRRGGGKSSAA